MTDWVKINLNSLYSDDQVSYCSDAYNDDLPDDWMNAPDPEELARKKKEEDERLNKEREDAIESERKRKQAIREEKIRKKKLLFDNENETNTFDDDLFEVTKEKKEISDFHNAIDAFGDLDMNTVNIDRIDIGVYKPETVAQFQAYSSAIKKKMNQIFHQIEQDDKMKKEYEQLKSSQNNDKVIMIKCLITALCDNYKSAFLADLYNDIICLYNKKLDETKKIHGYKKKPKNNTGSFFNYVNDNNDI